MAIEILLIRFFEISIITGFLTVSTIVGALLVLLKLGLFIVLVLLPLVQAGLVLCVYLIHPIIAVIWFFASQGLHVVQWSIGKTIQGSIAYGCSVVSF